MSPTIVDETKYVGYNKNGEMNESGYGNDRTGREKNTGNEKQVQRAACHTA